MNLRTITLWALYHPGRKEIIAARRFKYEIENMHRPSGSVLVKMKGHYAREQFAASGDRSET